MSLLLYLKNEICSAYKHGEFTLISGKKSDYYIDIKTLLLNPFFLDAVGKTISNIINMDFKNNSIFAVGGLELSSVPIASSICINSMYTSNALQQFIVRKKKHTYGTQSCVEGWDLIKNKNVILVDDILISGKSLKTAYNVLKDHCNVVACIVIIDRQKIDRQMLKRLPPILSLFKQDVLSFKL